MVPKGVALRLEFHYEADEGWSRQFYVGSEGALLNGEGTPWYPLPYNVRRATGILRFTVPQEFMVVAPGAKKTHQNGDKTFEFEVSRPSAFSFTVGRYIVYESRGNLPIAIYALRSRPGLSQQLNRIRKIIDALEQEFGSYPYEKFELVEVPTIAAGSRGNATGYPGLVTAAENNFEHFNLAVLAHEIGHEWWGDSVAQTGPRAEGMLSEAMAQYGALRAVETLEGVKAASDFRWRGYPGYSFMQAGLGYLSYMYAGEDAPLISSTNSELAYSKGFLVHDMLSRTIGRDRFRQIVSKFARDNAYQEVTWEQFMQVVQTGSEADLTWFFEQWLERKGVPELDLEWHQSGNRVIGSVRQVAPYYRADMELVIEGNGARRMQTVQLIGAMTEFTASVPFAAVAVRLDPESKVLHSTAERRREAESILPIARATPVWLQQRKVEGAESVLDREMKLLPSPDTYAGRFMAQAYGVFLASEAGKPEAILEHAKAALALDVQRPDWVPYVYYWQAVSAKATGDRALFEHSANAALAAERVLSAPSGWGQAAKNLLK
jgi:hypothetical protein